jgi:transposase
MRQEVAMEQYVGLDVAQKETAVCVVDVVGTKLWTGKCRSIPTVIAALLRERAPDATRVGMETGPLAVWYWHEFKRLGVPVVCIHARQAKAALSLQVNKTDQNDAHGLAQIVRTGWYRPVEMKSLASHQLRALLQARQQLVGIRTKLYNEVRGILKTFGVILPAGKGSTFLGLVHARAPEIPEVHLVIDTLLETWCEVQRQISQLDRVLRHTARQQPVCRRWMTVPGVGPLTAVAYLTTIDNPARFRRSKDVGPYLGLTPRRYQSGDVDQTGHISKCGDRLTRSLLFEAAGVLLSRSRAPSALKDWGLGIARRAGYAKARVAVARKLAILLHRLWVDNTEFVAAAA